jgi:hypothetical protein
MLVDDTCRMSSDAPFFVANMYYSQYCSQLSFVFRSTYMTFDAGACELVAIPQFADGTTMKRAVVTNSECASAATARLRARVALTCAPRPLARPLASLRAGSSGGGYTVVWYPVDSNCTGNPVATFTNLNYDVCVNIYSLGGAVVYKPPDFPTIFPPAPGGGGGKSASGAAAGAAAAGAALLLALAASAARAAA